MPKKSMHQATAPNLEPQPGQYSHSSQPVTPWLTLRLNKVGLNTPSGPSPLSICHWSGWSGSVDFPLPAYRPLSRKSLGKKVQPDPKLLCHSLCFCFLLDLASWPGSPFDSAPYFVSWLLDLAHPSASLTLTSWLHDIVCPQILLIHPDPGQHLDPPSWLTLATNLPAGHQATSDSLYKATKHLYLIMHWFGMFWQRLTVFSENVITLHQRIMIATRWWHYIKTLYCNCMVMFCVLQSRPGMIPTYLWNILPR